MDRHKTKIQINIFFLWKMKGVVEKKKWYVKRWRRAEEGGRDSQEFVWERWRPCTGLERWRGAEQTLWTRLDDSPFMSRRQKRGEVTPRFTVTTSRLYSVNVKPHGAARWITSKDTIPTHPQTPALFILHRFTLTQDHWHVSAHRW